MAIVYQYDKRHNVTYAYWSESYYDKDKKQSRSKRTLLGKVDPVTHEILPTRKTKRSKPLPQIPSMETSPSDEQGNSENERIVLLQAQINNLENKLKTYERDRTRDKEKMTEMISRLKQVISCYE